LYSLGCVMYEMLTGEPPFTADIPLAVTLKQVQEMPSTVTTLRSDVPKDVSELVIKLLAKQPRLRYQNATQLIQAIERIQAPAADSSRTTLFNMARSTFAAKRSIVIPAVIGVCVLASVVGVTLIGNGLATPDAAVSPTASVDATASVVVTSATLARPTSEPPAQVVPTAAPSPTPSAVLTVTNDTVNVRAGPNTRYDKLGELKRDQLLKVVGKSEDSEWLQIEFASAEGNKAWVKIQDGQTKLVQPNDAAKTALVIIVPTLPPQPVPASVCPKPGAALITFPQQGQTVRQELVVYGATSLPERGYAKVEIFKDNKWAFVNRINENRSIGSELGRIRAPEFSSLNSGVLRVRLVTVDHLGQEIATCQVSVVVNN
jgi:hypothetical protein